MPLGTEEEIKGYYAGRATAAGYVQHRFTSELHALLHDRQVAAVQRAFDRARPAWALEIAPGPGRLTRAVRPTGQLVCVEFNAGMVEQGRAACDPQRCRWVRGDGFRLPVGPVFDLAYSFRFIRHFRSADRARLYAEVRRVLRPGGWLVFDAVNERVSRPLREARPQEYPVYDELYRPDELRSELAAAGFTDVSLEPVQRWWGLQSRSQVLLGPRANWLNRLLIRAAERLPRREGLEWIVTCRRA
jgi:SAM-dependent methyltransferase